LRRAFRYGNSTSTVAIALAPTRTARAKARARAIAQGSVRVVGGSARMAYGVVTGSLGHRARGRRTFARGAGYIAGAVNVLYHEYRRPPERETARR